MKLNLHETFRVSSWGSPKMIQHVKDDPILQVSSQEPSTSSKYGLQGQGVPDTLLIMPESSNLAHNSRITYYDNPWCHGWPHPPGIQSGTINILQVWTSRMEGSWHTSNYANSEKLVEIMKFNQLFRILTNFSNFLPSFQSCYQLFRISTNFSKF